MEGRLILLVTVLMLYAAPGAAVLFFANDTQVNITQQGCGVTKLCVEIPNNCDPAGNQTCLFTSLAYRGTNLSIELEGQSPGFKLGLGVNASEVTMAFICGQNSSANGTFFFSAMPADMTVTRIQGLVKGNVIQCQFNLPNMTTTTLTILLGTGSVGINGLGNFTTAQKIGPLDVTNPASNLNTTTMAPTTMVSGTTTMAPTTMVSGTTTMAPTTMVNGTTTMTPTKGASGALHPQALLLLLSVLTLSVLQKA